MKLPFEIWCLEFGICTGCLLRERDDELGAIIPAEVYHPTELVYKSRHELKAEGLRVAKIDILGKPYTVVRHGKRYPLILRPQTDTDFPLAAIRKGMF